MKKTLTIFAVVFAVFTTKTVSAQTSNEAATLTDKSQTPEQRATKMTTILKDSLALSDAQYTKIYDINLKAAQQTDVAFKALGQSTITLQTKIKSINQLRDAAIKKQLTAEQLVHYETMKTTTKTTISTKTTSAQTTIKNNQTTRQQKIAEAKAKWNK
jgi:hypothetical protein